MSRAIRVLLAGLLVAFLGLLPGTASAHSDLISSDPADGAQLSAPPTAVTLVFSEPLLPDFVRVIGTDPDGNVGDLPIQSIDGSTAVIAWPAGAPGGTWTVEYRVVSQDGHPISGAVTFTYPAGSATPTPSPTPTSATPSPTTAPPTSSSPTAAPTSASPTTSAPTSAAPTPSAVPAASTSDTNTGWIIAGIAVVVLAAVAVVGLIVRRRSG